MKELLCELFFFAYLQSLGITTVCLSQSMRPGCPNTSCKVHTFNHQIIRDGFFYRRDDSRKIQRFKCQACLKKFSFSTFKLEYRQKKRRINYPLFKLLSSGVSLRRAAKILSVNKNTVAKKLPYLGEKYRRKNKKLLKNIEVERVQLDDLITKENSKLKPLAVSVIANEDNYLILGTKVSQIPSFGRLAKIAKKKYGHRPCFHKRGVTKLLKEVRPYIHKFATFKTDEHQNYIGPIKWNFLGATHLTFKSERAHVAGQGELKKVQFDPLFAINHTCAMLRANINRLIRKTWCTTKDPRRLQDHLDLYAYFHNMRVLEN